MATASSSEAAAAGTNVVRAACCCSTRAVARRAHSSAASSLKMVVEKKDSYKITALPGDGIGPEIMEATKKVCKAVAAKQGFKVEFTDALIGGAAFLVVGGSSVQFFVGGRTLNVFVVTATLASQSLDSNAALGNIDLGYKYHWWDGAVLPIGLGLSLVLNGIFFARPLNKMQLLTLPDLFARKFGPAVEMAFSIIAIVSFLCLLGGNLVGCGRILAFVFDITISSGVWIATFVIWLYTFAGGLVEIGRAHV